MVSVFLVVQQSWASRDYVGFLGPVGVEPTEGVSLRAKGDRQIEDVRVSESDGCSIDLGTRRKLNAKILATTTEGVAAEQFVA